MNSNQSTATAHSPEIEQLIVELTAPIAEGFNAFRVLEPTDAFYEEPASVKVRSASDLRPERVDEIRSALDSGHVQHCRFMDLYDREGNKLPKPGGEWSTLMAESAFYSTPNAIIYHEGMFYVSRGRFVAVSAEDDENGGEQFTFHGH